VIEVPRGSYVPAFRRSGNYDRREPPAPAAAPAAASNPEPEESAEFVTCRQELAKSINRFGEFARAHQQQVAAMAAVVGTGQMLVDSRALLQACENLDLACSPDRPLLPTAQPHPSNDIRPADGREAQRQQTQGKAAAGLRRPRAN
jgi:hypothetical protein